MAIPETRASLILRLADAQDAAAWDEFAQVYEPLIYRLAYRQGLQHADAQELVQEVLLAVAKAVERWTPNQQQGRFRSWIFRIARNMAINILTRRKFRPLAAGDSAVARLLANCPAPGSTGSGECEELFDLEYRRAVFLWAARQVRGEVAASTWEAFWLTAVEDQPIAEAAAHLKLSVGNVYVARSRVMARLQHYAQRFDGMQQHNDPPSPPAAEVLP